MPGGHIMLDRRSFSIFIRGRAAAVAPLSIIPKAVAQAADEMPLPSRELYDRDQEAYWIRISSLGH
jgi:hypothetical protein